MEQPTQLELVINMKTAKALGSRSRRRSGLRADWASGQLQALKEILGHATLAMTMRYAHLGPEHLRSEITKTERPVGPESGTTEVSVEDQREVHLSSMLE